MKPRSGPVAVAVIVVMAVALSFMAIRLRSGRTPTAIVLVSIDTLRADRVGAYGSDARLTPNLDRLAAKGVVFENAWTTAPLTVPAHTSMLTGLLPPLHGLRTNARGQRLPAATARPYATVAEVFRRERYRTGAFISASVLRGARTGLDAGFDVYDDVAAAAPGALHDTERDGVETVEAALAWVRGSDERFFLWVHLFDPHAPYDAPGPWGAGAEHTNDATGYDAEVRYADHALGLLHDGLKEAGFADALIVVVSDHGEALGAHGESTHGYLLHEETLHVPFVISAPGLVAEGVRRQEPVSVGDVAPTLVTLAGISLPPMMDGRPLFAGGSHRKERVPYAESLYGYETSRWAQIFALRLGDRKLVDAGPRTLVIDLAQPGGDDAPVTLPALPQDGTSTADPEARRVVDDELRRIAGLPPLAPPAESDSEVAGGSYWSATAERDGILPRAENAALPSPYDRMDVARLLDDGRAQLAGGNAGGAEATFRAVLRSDPGNPQAHRWLARSLQALARHAESAAMYRTAFEKGWRHTDCVTKALQVAMLATQTNGRSEADIALTFLKATRGQGVAQDGPGFVFEALLLHEVGRSAEALRALQNARSEPETPQLTKLIEGTEQRLR